MHGDSNAIVSDSNVYSQLDRTDYFGSTSDESPQSFMLQPQSIFGGDSGIVGEEAHRLINSDGSNNILDKSFFIVHRADSLDRGLLGENDIIISCNCQ